jgi:hypothetical protein
MVLGTGAVMAGMLVISGISVESGLGFLVAGLVLSGLGLGSASVASTATGTAAVAAGDQGLASGLLNTAAQLGIAGLVTIAAARNAGPAGGDDPTAAELVADIGWPYWPRPPSPPAADWSPCWWYAGHPTDWSTL